MNICLILPNVFPVPATKGGATEMLITNFLKENEKQGLMNFTCISVYEEKAKELSKEYKHTEFIFINQKRDNLDLTFETEDKYFRSYMDEIYEKIKEKSFDYIIIEGGNITGYKYLLDKFPREKCLVHIHGNVLGNNKINDEIYEKFIAISEYTSKLIMQDGIIDEKKIELLYNAIKLQDFDKKIPEDERNCLRAKYEISKEDVVILFTGRTIPQKGVKELITSFKKLKNIEKCKLLIVGSANYGEKVKMPYDYELEELTKDVKDKIKFTGYINNNELYKIYNISDIAVFPSMWEELFGLVIVEAMASSLPVIITNSGGMPEVVDEKCAYIIEKDEKLIDNMTQKIDYLIEHPYVREKMGMYSRKRAEKFEIEQYLINFYKLMEKIKNEKG